VGGRVGGQVGGRVGVLIENKTNSAQLELRKKILTVSIKFYEFLHQ
jgi:hypothetical protein